MSDARGSDVDSDDQGADTEPAKRRAAAPRMHRQSEAEPTGRQLEIAVRAGYGSPEALARAFREVHGVAPRTARCSKVQQMTQLRVSSDSPSKATPPPGTRANTTAEEG